MLPKSKSTINSNPYAWWNISSRVPDSRTVVPNGGRTYKVEKNIKFRVLGEEKGASFRAGPVNVSLETFAIQNEFYSALDHKLSRVHCFRLRLRRQSKTIDDLLKQRLHCYIIDFDPRNCFPRYRRADTNDFNNSSNIMTASPSRWSFLRLEIIIITGKMFSKREIWFHTRYIA